MMIDIHNHILPGLDDGAKDLEMSVAMANVAVQEGITHILATPHHRNGEFVNSRAQVEEAVGKLQVELDQRGINLVVFPGQEVRLHGDLLANIDAGEILFTDLDEHYLLIEFPSMEVPHYAEQVFFDLLSRNIRPIIVHPERNQKIIEKPDILKHFVDMGCYAQVTAASYLGEFGPGVEDASSYMIENNLVHMMASDAHRLSGPRGFNLEAAFEKMQSTYGSSIVFDFKANAKSLVNGDPMISNFIIEEPKKKKKKFFGLF
jgi:protein-tyrosine phosphatase